MIATGEEALLVDINEGRAFCPSVARPFAD